MSLDIEGAAAYIAEVRWQFAKTMPQWPHEYTVRKWRPDLLAAFTSFAELIRQEGVFKPWPADAAVPRYHHAYLEIEGWVSCAKTRSCRPLSLIELMPLASTR